MIRLTIVLLSVVLLATTYVHASPNIVINRHTVEEGSEVTVYEDALIGRKISIELHSDASITAVEISFDEGKTWHAMEESSRDKFTLEHRIRKDGSYRPIFLLEEAQGSIRTYNPLIAVVYHKKRPREQVEKILKDMKKYYGQEKLDRFMKLLSSQFPDRIEFKEAIRNDFYNYRKLRLRYNIDRFTMNSDETSAILDVVWDRKFTDRNDVAASDRAAMKMHIAKERHGWKIIGLDNNTLFGSTLIPVDSRSANKPDLSIVAADLENDGMELKATIRNLESVTANTIQVEFLYELSGGGFASDGIETISIIGGNSQDFVLHAFTQAAGVYNIRVKVDPRNKIAETNESNNEVQKTLNLS